MSWLAVGFLNLAVNRTVSIKFCAGRRRAVGVLKNKLPLSKKFLRRPASSFCHSSSYLRECTFTSGNTFVQSLVKVHFLSIYLGDVPSLVSILLYSH